MEKMIAYCGLTCTDCDAYIATQQNDDKMRREIAADWTQKYHHDFKPEDINCDGCLPDTVKTIGQLNVCPIRKCGQARGVPNCGRCPDYSCDKTEEFFQMVPDCKKTLDAVRQRAKYK